MADVSERVKLGWLLDFYGPLLTEHRREVLRLYCEEDLSLAEIAEQLSITRQGVSDAVNKARHLLTQYEDKLGLLARYRTVNENAQRCLDALNTLPEELRREDAVRRACAAASAILQNEEVRTDGL